MTRHILNPYVRVNLMGSFVGVPYNVGGELVAVEFYAGSVPTFTFLADTGHLYAYLPPHAFGHSSRQDLAELVDVECPAESPSVFVLPSVDAGGVGRVGKAVVPWERYVCSVDWAEANVLVHLVMLYDGAPAFMRNSRFQIGGRTWEPPAWKKTRHEWKLSNRAVCLIVKRGDEYLAVARNAEGTTWGLPAGGVDPGETPDEAVARELKEETGLTLGCSVLLDEREWRGNYLFCYVGEVEGEPDDDETLRAREEYVTRWVDRSALCAGEFGEYNAAIFKEYGGEIERGLPGGD